MGSDAAAVAGRSPERPAGRLGRGTAFDSSTPWRTIGIVAAVSVVAAALSLRLPWATTYDPWAWIVWGREVVHLDLQTVDGPSWKPLPVLFTTIFSLAGPAAPALWLIAARAGGLLAIAAAYAVGRRLSGAVAGAAAATALILDVPFARVVWLGDSEGLLVAAVLAAVERHLAGARRTAFAFGVVAALLRPEVWPFLALYGIWLGWRDPGSRLLVAASWVALAFLWFVPELWGSGHLWRSAVRARQPAGGAAAFAPDPAFEVVMRARLMLVGPVKAAALFALVYAAARPRSAAARAVLLLAAAAAAWVAMVAVMTAHGFSGNERYVMAPMAIVCTLAGVGVAVAAGIVMRLVRGRQFALRLAAVAAVVAVSAGTIPYVAATAEALGRQAATLEYQAALRGGMTRAVARFGGGAAVRACGQSATEDYSVPMLAWDLGVHIATVGLDPPQRGVVFQARPTPAGAPDPPVHRRRQRFAFRSGPVRVFSTCPPVRRSSGSNR